jgi:hypothetical protein
MYYQGTNDRGELSLQVAWDTQRAEAHRHRRDVTTEEGACPQLGIQYRGEGERILS